MFDFPLFAWLVAFAAPAVLVAVPRQMRGLHPRIAQRSANARSLPALTSLAVTQSLVLVIGGAALGSALAAGAGLKAPFFEALAGRGSIWLAIRPQVIPATILAVGGALVLMGLYYGLFRPRMDRQFVRDTEKLRLEMGIVSRVLFGGIVEEILFRWGVMTGLVWLGIRISGSPTPLVMWGAIVGAGVLFGLSHVPGSLALGAKRTPLLVAGAVMMNLSVGLIFGWLYWRYGLLAAMIAHALVHVVWLPFDRHFFRTLPAKAQAI